MEPFRKIRFFYCIVKHLYFVKRVGAILVIDRYYASSLSFLYISSLSPTGVLGASQYILPRELSTSSSLGLGSTPILSVLDSSSSSSFPASPARDAHSTAPCFSPIERSSLAYSTKAAPISLCGDAVVKEDWNRKVIIIKKKDQVNYI